MDLETMIPNLSFSEHGSFREKIAQVLLDVCLVKLMCPVGRDRILSFLRKNCHRSLVKEGMSREELYSKRNQVFYISNLAPPVTGNTRPHFQWAHGVLSLSRSNIFHAITIE